jgi:hypothetical protein
MKKLKIFNLASITEEMASNWLQDKVTYHIFVNNNSLYVVYEDLEE